MFTGFISSTATTLRSASYVYLLWGGREETHTKGDIKD